MNVVGGILLNTRKLHLSQMLLGETLGFLDLFTYTNISDYLYESKVDGMVRYSFNYKILRRKIKAFKKCVFNIANMKA